MKSDVWLTPPEIIEALGPFDLDPCAAPEPRPWPTAARHVALPTDGLTVPWSGFVWCNPPYNRGVVSWMRRMAEHANGIAVVFARTETEWFWETVWTCPTATAALFLEGRLFFHHHDGRRAASNAGAPSVLVAYGRHAAGRLLGSGIKGAFVMLGRTTP